ncbi:MAG: hypothetical protein M5U01_33760 [Ardenticatenaceae bacterium]|nr:hypothetical protein [Ardenticatenaceae bacterium]HBY92915.1 hypothetical protein [Chloroflexota bacterium]
MAVFIKRKAKKIKKIVLCYEESLPANWLVGISKLRGKLERAGIEVGGSSLVIDLYHGRERVQKAHLGLGADIINASIHELPHDADIIVTTEKLAQRAQEAVPQAWVIPVARFSITPIYDEIVAKLVAEEADQRFQQERGL